MENKVNAHDDPTPVSVNTLLEGYDRLGIPHFQRGLLWKSDSVALLLESLYHGTPCGTILLWKPLRPAEHGVPLRGAAPDLDLMIVDGQQRLRSLHGVVTSETGHTEEWLLNLARIPDISAIAGLKGNDLDLFHRRKVEHGESVPPPGHVRLEAIWASRWEDVRADLRSSDLFDQLEKSGVFRRVQGMLSRKLFWLARIDETLHGNDLAAVVRIYNRINSAGVQVEPEERAYAALVAARPQFAAWIRDLFEEVHVTNSGGTSALSDRDEMLRREQERRFGFKLFIRVFVQYWAYHCRDTKGENSLSFDLLTNPRVMSRLTDPSNQEHIEHLLEQSRKAIRFVHVLLKDDLGCDSYAFLPETRALIPIFQLLVRFPGLMSDSAARVEIQWLILRLLLAARMSQRDVVVMVRAVNSALLASDALAMLRTRFLDTRHLERTTAKALADGRSINDRYLLLLYWLARRNGAKDFSYKNLGRSEELFRQTHPTELPLSTGAYPEKQHILPFSKLRPVFNITGRGRPAAHEANNVGNMTYISRALNDFDGGLGSKCMDVRLEGENLRAHFIPDRAAHILEMLRAKDAWTDKDKSLVSTFMKRRRESVLEGFLQWLEDLSHTRVADRIEADRRRLDPDESDLIRSIRYPDALEDALLNCLIRYRCRGGEREDGDLVVRLGERGVSGTLQVRLNAGAIIVKGRRDRVLTERFRSAAVAAEERKTSSVFRFVLPAAAGTATDAFAALCVGNAVLKA